MFKYFGMDELLINLPVLIFLIILVNYTVGAFFIVYHLTKFGLDYKTKLLAFVFSIGSIFLIIVSFQLFSKIQWTELIYEYLSFPKII